MTVRAQGVPRRLPDGLLHLQNFTVTKHSGMAGFLFAKVMTKAQQDIVELCLIQKLTKNGYFGVKPETWNEDHGCHRFPKGFLRAQFKPTVYAVYYALGKNAVDEMSSMVCKEINEALV